MLDRTANTVAVAFALAFAAGLALSLVGARPADAEPLQQSRGWPYGCRSSCDGFARSSPLPSLLLHGEATTVTLDFHATCYGAPAPLHIVFAVNSSSMESSREARDLREALLEIVDDLDLENSPSTQIALVDGGDGARTLMRLGSDAEYALRAIGRLEAGGDTDLVAVIGEARRAMEYEEPEDPCTQPYANEVVVLASADIQRSACTPAKRAARDLKQRGMLTTVLCPRSRCRDDVCLRDLASSSRYYFDLSNLRGLIATFGRIRDELINITIRQLIVTETLREGVDFVPGSATDDEKSPIFELDGRRLRWTMNYVPKDGVTFTYQVRPVSPGFHQVTEPTHFAWRDNQNRFGELWTGPSWVQVFAPRGVDP